MNSWKIGIHIREFTKRHNVSFNLFMLSWNPDNIAYPGTTLLMNFLSISNHIQTVNLSLTVNETIACPWLVGCPRPYRIHVAKIAYVSAENWSITDINFFLALKVYYILFSEHAVYIISYHPRLCSKIFLSHHYNLIYLN